MAGKFFTFFVNCVDMALHIPLVTELFTTRFTVIFCISIQLTINFLFVEYVP